MNRFTKILAVALMLTISIAACGKKGSPEPPGENNQYPKQYPKPK